MVSVVDHLGLVLENNFLAVYIPAKNSALVFRVKSRQNRGFEELNYGGLPLSSGDTLPTYDGGSATVPEDGVLPARAYTKSGKGFPMTGAYDPNDMWYLPYRDYKDRLFHVIQYVTPSFIRIDLQIPRNVVQGRFQRDRVIVGVDKDFGFSRGVYETVHLPEIYYGYRWGNDTNIDLYTFVKFVYAEYIIEIPKDPELIFNILTKRIPCKWISLPINSWDVSIEGGLLKTYGFIGFKLYGIHQKEEAIREYAKQLKEVLI
ncbi:hypothetical protein J7K27_05900 [Candidatus Bathyarchaeota archaeon]|nr:hypothetical protein [Candidatus Bathyarchaeota archaeon]